MTDRDTKLMRQALDALEQHDNPQRWPFAVKQDSRAVRAALRARLAEPVQASTDVPEANCGKINAMQEGRDRYTNKASIMAFVEGAWWAAQQLTAPAAAPTVQSVVVPMVGSCQQCGHAHEIPSHLALVSVEPTPEMVKAGTGWGTARSTWAAMIDAAPKRGIS